MQYEYVCPFVYYLVHEIVSCICMIVIVIARCEMSACLVQVGGYRACSTSESECEAIVVEYLSCEITVIVRAEHGRSLLSRYLPPCTEYLVVQVIV